MILTQPYFFFIAGSGISIYGTGVGSSLGVLETGKRHETLFFKSKHCDVNNSEWFYLLFFYRFYKRNTINISADSSPSMTS